MFIWPSLVQGVSKKTHHKVLCSFCLISPTAISLESSEISQNKGDVHRYVLSTISFLSDIGELRYRQNNTGYQIIKKVKYRLIFYSWNLIPHIVLPISQLLNIVQSTVCIQNVPMNISFHLTTSSLLCNIGKPRYTQNSRRYQILRTGY